MIKRALQSKRNYWILFAAVQMVGIVVPSLADLHTNPLPLMMGIVLLLPGVLAGLAFDMHGPVALPLAVVLNAAAWYFVRKTSHLDPAPHYPQDFES